MCKAKLFWKKERFPKKISAIAFGDEEEYYHFLQKQFNSGYRQIIISSEAMIEIIKDAVQEGYSVYHIDFAEEDAELGEEVEQILRMIGRNPACFYMLIDKLQFLAEESSIDVQRIKIKGRTVDGRAVDFYVQANGIIGINEEMYSEILDWLSRLTERCLFG